MKKSQVFSLDFVFSIAVLILIFSILGSTWLNLQTSIAKQEEQRRAVEVSSLAIDFLVSSPGFPENWADAANLSVDSFSNFGLKGGKGLSLAKLLAMLNFSGDYLELKAKAGMPGYDYRLAVFENLSSSTPTLSGVAREPVAYFASDSRDFFNTLDSSGVVWDYYWGQGASGQPSWGSSRSQYPGEKAAVFNQMLSNQSLYNSMVVEAPEMLLSQINSTLLKEFLQKGGTVAYISGNTENELLVEGLGVAFRKSAVSVPGVVQSKGFFLHNTSVGSNVSSGGEWVAFSPNGATLEVFASNQTNSSEGIAAAWDYGIGRVYFANDFQASFNGIPASQVLNVIGWRLDYGFAPPSNASFVFPQTRFAFIEGDRRIPVAVSLVLWNG